MSDDFDPTPYVRAPIFDVASGVALGIALLSSASKSAPDHVKKAAKKVHKDTVTLQSAWAKADAIPTQPDKRKADMRIDNAWGILLDRLAAYALLPVGEYPKAAMAQTILDAFAKDRAWLKLPYAAEWAESGKRLQKIDDENLGPEIDTLAGPEFLKELRQAHKGYGIALGVTEAAPEAPQVSLADPLRSLSRSIARYGLAVAGMVDDDGPTLTLVRKALRPLDDYREAQTRRTSSSGQPEPAAPPATPTTPVPEPA